MMTELALFDTHAHLDEPELARDLAGVLERARLAGVRDIATIGYDWQSSLYAVYLAEKHEHIYAVAGVHPHEIATAAKETYAKLAELAKSPEVKAVGEIGLDYYRDLTPREAQKRTFIKQIHLAKDLRKPIVIHDRDAHADMMKIIRAEKAGEFGGVIHCYSGSWEMAKECMKLGFMIAIGGAITFKNARVLPEVAAKIPLDYLLIETDCPYLTPEPFRGKTNEPARVRLVAEKISAIREDSLENIAKMTTENAYKLYGLNSL